MEQRSKILSYLGFAIKARKIVFGVNAVQVFKKKAYLLICCSSASQNTYNEAVKLSNKLNCQLLISKKYLVEDIANKLNCKLLCVTDEGFAKAILNNVDGDWSLVIKG